jgi:hypothetical protein
MKRPPSRFSLPPLSWIVGSVVIVVVGYFGMNWMMGKFFEPSAGELAAASARARVPIPTAAPPKQATSPPLDLGPGKVDPPPEAPPAVMVRAPSEPHRRSGGKQTTTALVGKPHGYGTLSVRCVPWCHIYVDGLDTEQNSPVSGLKLSAGRHELRVVNPPSGRTRDIEVDIEGGTNLTQRIEFEKGTASLQHP